MHLDNFPYENSLSFYSRILAEFTVHTAQKHAIFFNARRSLLLCILIFVFIKNSLRLVSCMEICASQFLQRKFSSRVMLSFNLWWDQSQRGFLSLFLFFAQSQMEYIIHKQIILMEISFLFNMRWLLICRLVLNILSIKQGSISCERNFGRIENDLDFCICSAIHLIYRRSVLFSIACRMTKLYLKKKLN